ncbi:MAG: hypothetical protein ACP5E3_11390, partial [Bacteroidales bacterium]
MSSNDKEIIIETVARAFSQSPRLLSIMKDGDKERRLRIMAEYAYHLVSKFDGIYLSEDKTTVLMYWTKKQYKRDLIDLYRYLTMFFKCIKPGKAISTMKREKLVESLRPDLPDYIYVWVLGQNPEKTSLRGLADIRDHLFGISEEKNLPILIETTVEKVLKLYKYVGFDIYNEWYDETINMPVWFL